MAKMDQENGSVAATTTMAALLKAYPGARRALFARYHIGGCQSCAFSPEETVQELCARNGDLPVEEVLDHVRSSHDEDAAILIQPEELAVKLAGERVPRLVDIRTREEFEAVHIEGARLFGQELLQEAYAGWDKEEEIVMYDHTGQRSLDAAAYLIGHGFDAVFALDGGIDAYSQRVDSSLPRYRVEIEQA
jgi:rhodanese-related sulfurtransferase